MAAIKDEISADLADRLADTLPTDFDTAANAAIPAPSRSSASVPMPPSGSPRSRSTATP
jgi:hypothetical protein